nr:tape measure protein [uncultured Rhodoferax sp.]
MADPKIKYDIEAAVKGNAEVNQLASEIDKLAGTLDGDLKTNALAAADALRQLAAKDAAIKNFADLKQQAQDAAKGLQDAQAAAQKLGAELASVQTPTRAQAGQMQKLGDAVKSAKTEVTASTLALEQARTGLAQYGLNTDQLSQKQGVLKAAIATARAEASAMVPALQNAAAAATDSAAKQVNASKQVSDGMKSVSTQINDAKNLMLGFVGVQGLASTVKDVAALADEWANMKSRLQLALGAQTDVNQAMLDAEATAKRTYTSLDATANLYGKIATTGKAMGVSQQQALGLTESINQAIQLSGSSAQASEAAITQLIQGLQSGVLRGDEFNSVMEQAPRLAKAMADGLNVPIGTLRGMAEEGKLTSQTVIRALQGQSQAIGDEFSKLPVTIGRAVQNVQTEWQKFVGTMDASTGASSAVAAGIESIGKHLDDLARVATVTGAALTASFAIQAAKALRTAAAEMAATGGAAALLRRDLDTLSRPVKIAIVVTGFEEGYRLGRVLYDNSELARKLGIGMVNFLRQVVNDIQFLAEAAAAVFTSDTVNAALDRYVKRNIEIGNAFSELYVDAKNAPNAVGAAVDEAAQKTQAMGAAAQATGATVANAGAAGAAGMSKIGKAAEDARSALEGVAALLNTAPPVDNGITTIVRDLTAVKARGVDVDLLLRQQLPEAIGKLNGPELSKFRAEFIRAMDEAGIKGKELTTGLSLIAAQAASSLGVDVPLAFNTLSESFKSAQGNMSVLIRELPALKAAGVDTGMVVQQALAGMIDSTKSRAELEAVRRQIEALRQSLGDKVADGLLDQATQKANALKDALDQATPGVNGLREAMKLLGVTSDEALKQTATQSANAYQKMKESGTASIRELQDGFKKYAADAIAANGGVATEALKSEAAMRGLQIQTDSTGKSIINAMDAGKSSTDHYTTSVHGATQALELQNTVLAERKAALDALNAATTPAPVKSILTKDDMKAVDNTGLWSLQQKQQSGTLGKDDLTTAEAALQAATVNLDMYQKNTAAFSLQGAQSITESYNAARMIAEMVRKMANGNSPQQSQNSGNQSSTQTYTINLNVNGQNTPINVASPTDAQNFIAALQRAKLSA